MADFDNDKVYLKKLLLLFIVYWAFITIRLIFIQIFILNYRKMIF